jgi:hypothetical protein
MHASNDRPTSVAGLLSLAPIRTACRALNRLRSGIGLRLLASVLLLSTAITLLLTLLQLYVDYRRDVERIERRMSEIEGSYLRSLGEGLWNLDVRQLELQIDGILRLPAIRFVEVRETTDRADPMVVRGGRRQDHAAVRREFSLFNTSRGAPRIFDLPYGPRHRAAAGSSIDRGHAGRGVSRAPRQGDHHPG